jgi:hypothetical protein
MKDWELIYNYTTCAYSRRALLQKRWKYFRHLHFSKMPEYIFEKNNRNKGWDMIMIPARLKKWNEASEV